MRQMDGYDVVVVGGGPGGVAAAISAGRSGARTLLVEREGCLGGAMTTMLVCPFMCHTTAPGPDQNPPRKILNAGLFRELTRRLVEVGQAVDSPSIVFDDEAAKRMLDVMVQEAGVDVIFHAALYDAEARDSRVTAALFAHNGGPFRVTGKVFIDSTGDALLAARAGAEFEFGDAQGHVMPMTTKFVIGGVDLGRIPDKAGLQALAAAGASDTPALINTNVSTFRVKPDKGWVHINCIRVTGNTLDPLDLSRCEMEGRRRVENFIAWLRANVPGYEACYLVKTGHHIGVRESRRVKGDYTLTYDDWKRCAKFDDGIACTSYSVDVHGQTQGQTRLEYLPPGAYYQIPYRCLTPRSFKNLLVAGRSISADIEAHSSLRIMPPIMNVGEAAGLAAAMSLPGGEVRQIDVQALRQKIRDAGGVLEV